MQVGISPPPLLGEMLPSITIHLSICLLCFFHISSVGSCHTARGSFQSPVPGEHHLVQFPLALEAFYPRSVLNYPIDPVTSWRHRVPSQKANRSRAQHPRKRPSNRLESRHRKKRETSRNQKRSHFRFARIVAVWVYASLFIFMTS